MSKKEPDELTLSELKTLIEIYILLKDTGDFAPQANDIRTQIINIINDIEQDID